MSYYIGRMVDLSFSEAIEKVTEELKKEGFGVITEIDVKEILKNKLDLDFRPYVILGACNPHYAHQALSLDDKIGALLPCNVIVQQTEEGTEVFAMNPQETMSKLLGEEIEDIAKAISEKIQNVLDRL
ncbi:DUF302 domain-containing protein [Bacteroidota bacterium]